MSDNIPYVTVLRRTAPRPIKISATYCVYGTYYCILYFSKERERRTAVTIYEQWSVQEMLPALATDIPILNYSCWDDRQHSMSFQSSRPTSRWCCLKMIVSGCMPLVPLRKQTRRAAPFNSIRLNTMQRISSPTTVRVFDISFCFNNSFIFRIHRNIPLIRLPSHIFHLTFLVIFLFFNAVQCSESSHRPVGTFFRTMYHVRMTV